MKIAAPKVHPAQALEQAAPLAGGRFHRRSLLWFLGLFVFLLAAAVVSAGLGEIRIPPLDVVRAAGGAGLADHVLVVQSLRLPRIAISMLVGASLAVAGAILQGVVRNPLAAPDVVGISGGASLAAAAFLTLIPGAYSIQLLPVAAMIGAVLVSSIVYLLAWKRGVQTFRLVLIGIGVAMLMNALTTFMIMMAPSTYTAGAAYLWLTGTVYGTSWTNVLTLLPWTALFLLLAAGHVRHLNAQLLGDELAAGIGSAVQRGRISLLLISVGLAGSAISMAGPIGFVGLLAPHMARRLVGSLSGRLLPVAGVIGALIVLIADTVARTVFLPHDIPAGILTSGIGAPFFVYLLYRTRKSR
ncbi:FecCD family ABC transporter permease [Paenibacillus xanthanilyticus]|uniref:FecCD family ABC transporter permease n=1 Tax=Paenibacillus xanthanilyticus TaxID=1783531 RepID=A0ABV8JZZ0_9BACL